MQRPGAKHDSRDRLSALDRIAREVNSAPNLDAALRTLVRLTRQLMGTDVCTVYFSDQSDRRHVIVATDGLASGVIGKLQSGFGEGLVGQVAADRRVLNLHSVPGDRDDEFQRQSGSGPYRAFLGTPITHKGQVQGVLVVRQRESRRFDDADEAVLTTLAAQLGVAIAYARASGDWCALCRPNEAMPRQVQGQAGAPGMAIGTGVVVFSQAGLAGVPDRTIADVQSECTKLLDAVAAVRTELLEIRDDAGANLTDIDRTLFDAYVLMLDDPEFIETSQAIVRQGIWAPAAVSHTVERFAATFDSIEDPYLRDRGSDVRALGARVVARLLGEANAIVRSDQDTVLVGHRLSAIDIGQARAGKLVGIITGDGSSLSHAAILARSLGIPAVMGVSELPLQRLEGKEICVDGNSGTVHLDPTPAMRKEFETTIREQADMQQRLDSMSESDARTADGHAIALYVNSGLSTDLRITSQVNAAGVGLYRSELAFMLFDRFPSEQEQLTLYRDALQTIAPLPLTLRTLDAGGDKALPYLPADDVNPALGWRGTRYMLDHPDIFLTQLRAALRADIGLGNLRLLLPMIGDVDELEQALALLDQATQQLRAESYSINRPPVGVMIETPSAVYQAEALARRADFISVGTNDLAQYVLAADRNNPRVSDRLAVTHPSLLQAVRQVVLDCRRVDKPVTVCGEIAGHPATALVLLGLGADGLSISPAALSRVKWAIGAATTDQMRSLAEAAIRTRTREAMSRLLESAERDFDLQRGIVGRSLRDGTVQSTVEAR